MESTAGESLSDKITLILGSSSKIPDLLELFKLEITEAFNISNEINDHVSGYLKHQGKISSLEEYLESKNLAVGEVMLRVRNRYTKTVDGSSERRHK